MYVCVVCSPCVSVLVRVLRQRLLLGPQLILVCLLPLVFQEFPVSDSQELEFWRSDATPIPIHFFLNTLSALQVEREFRGKQMQTKHSPTFCIERRSGEEGREDGAQDSCRRCLSFTQPHLARRPGNTDFITESCEEYLHNPPLN